MWDLRASVHWPQTKGNADKWLAFDISLSFGQGQFKISLVYI